MNNRKILSLGLAVALLVWPAVLTSFFSQYSQTYIPTLVDHAGGFVAVGLLLFVASETIFLFGFIWVLWYFLGTLNIISSSLILGQYYSNLDISTAAQIYLWGAAAYILGCIVGEAIERYRFVPVDRLPIAEISGLAKAIVLIFPIPWIASIYISLGYIPIVSGFNITDDIYELQYGPLYPYTVILAVTLIYLFRLLLWRKITAWAWFYFVFVLLVSFADGKRVIAMIFLGATIPILFQRYGEKSWRSIGLTSLVLIVLYVFVQILRQGLSTDRYESDSIAKFMAIGVEFRDFVFSVNFFDAGNIPGYSWIKSALGSMINSSILRYLGFDKSELVQMGSAYVWAHYFKSPFGIRTGIISEFWFAYKYFGFLALMMFGLLTSYLTLLIPRCKTEIGCLAIMTILGLFVTAIVGQATAVLGSVTVVIYFYIVLQLVSIVRDYRLNM